MITRKSSRAIILNKKNEIFLFQYHFDYFIKGNIVWITPGGGLEEGESFDMALEREVFEELGIQINRDYQQIYYRNPVYYLKNGEIAQCEERFFLVYADGNDFSYTNWTESENTRMLDGKWWSADEIKQSDDEFFTNDIIDILNNLSAGQIPMVPIEIA
ncbi:8-oxo-dGTP pyrophosphatase MutT (NUDIX family) [Anaerotaenia torta]|uniref:NUDIX hydrolase n=1 Tax=Anaerotaenia torta TaxID=433293 RepID=UPI003D231AB3